jgi:protein SCO1/2
MTASEGHEVKESFTPVKMQFKADGMTDGNMKIGVDETTGRKIASDLLFKDERGRDITPGSFIDRPVIILPVFYSCTQSCGMMLGSLATALNKVPLVPGRDYRVLAISIDSEEDPLSAARSKENYFRLITREFPAEEWLFLTGDQGNIKKFTDSMGFSFKRVSRHNFLHPNVMVIVSHDGTIIRYMYGPAFLPFDIGMALTEASAGIPSISVRKVLSYCFTYDPERKTYTLDIIRYIIISILGLIGVTLFLLLGKKNTH